jgi:hypothetical protein
MGATSALLRSQSLEMMLARLDSENVWVARQKVDGGISWNSCSGRSTSAGANC